MIDLSRIHPFLSRGDGLAWLGHLAKLGENAIIETGVRIFHPENVEVGANAFIGHDTLIDGYYKGRVTIGEGTWIGPLGYLHGAGFLEIGRAVGIGPRVTVFTSEHELTQPDLPVLHADLSFAAVRIADGADIGAAATLLPGVSIGEGAVVGAGAVVTRDVPPGAIVAGNPARFLRLR